MKTKSIEVKMLIEYREGAELPGDIESQLRVNIFRYIDFGRAFSLRPANARLFQEDLQPIDWCITGIKVDS